MITKKRYWGLALPICDCQACGDGRGHRWSRGAPRARGRRLGRVRGPYAASALRRRGQDRLPELRRADRTHPRRRQPVAGRGDRAVLDAPLPRRIRTTGDSGSRPTSSPRASPASSATGSTRCSRCRTVLRREPPFKTIFGYATGRGRGRPPDAQELGQRHRVRRGRRPDGRRRHALDVRPGTAGGQHRLRLALGRRGPARAARPVERLLLLRDLRPARELDTGRGGATGRRTADPRSLDPVAGRRYSRGHGGATAPSTTQ